jgi:hypothetical protein
LARSGRMERTTRNLARLGHPDTGFRVVRPYSLYNAYSYAKLPNLVTRQEQENQDRQQKSWGGLFFGLENSFPGCPSGNYSPESLFKTQAVPIGNQGLGDFYLSG